MLLSDVRLPASRRTSLFLGLSVGTFFLTHLPTLHDGQVIAKDDLKVGGDTEAEASRLLAEWRAARKPE